MKTNKRVTTRDCMNVDNMSIISTESDDTLLDVEEQEFLLFINKHKEFVKNYF